MTLLIDQGRLSLSLGRYREPYEKALGVLGEMRFSEKLRKKDPSIWKSDPEVQEKIKNRLGWLTVAETMEDEAEAVMDFARSVRDTGITHIVLLGMGGSSLCPEVCRKTFGVSEGYPDLIVLDSTDPSTLLRVEREADLAGTLFILASKSGSTIEMQSLYRYFDERVRAVRKKRPGDQFIAITDPGTSLEALSRAQGFRECFVNPPDIGGRYSALSFFGLVPAALIGVDLNDFLKRARDMEGRCGAGVPDAENPGTALGAVLGGLGAAGRDKVTIVVSGPAGLFGLWAEQLIAESTGKEGQGLVPVEGERLGEPGVYAGDRLFVHLSFGSSPDPERERRIQALQDAGHPVVRIRLRDSLDLAGEFLRWELATAAAGAVLGINPFDEPNVTESKENTNRVLAEYQKKGRLELPEPVVIEDGLALCGGPGTAEGNFKDALEGFLRQAAPRDYVAIMAYVEQSDRNESLLQSIRHGIRDRFRTATTLGYGPRFLHSTGQLHKGGAGNGLFIQVTQEDPEEVPIPGAPYGFGVLKRAQALGDYYSLTSRRLRTLEIRLGRDAGAGLEKVLDRMNRIQTG